MTFRVQHCVDLTLLPLTLLLLTQTVIEVLSPVEIRQVGLHYNQIQNLVLELQGSRGPAPLILHSTPLDSEKNGTEGGLV